MNFNRQHRLFFLILTSLIVPFVLPGCHSDDNTVHSFYLSDGWEIHSSSEDLPGGQEISSLNYKPSGWYQTGVPATVMTALVKNKVFKNPFYGKNLEKIPHDIFENAWWYRKEFSINNDAGVKNVRVIFEGINYRANVWLNGILQADRSKIEGSFGIFEMDVTRSVRRGKNILAVEVFPPEKGDLTIGFVDWNPPAPDKNMGLWRGVRIRTNHGVSVNDIFVRSKLNLESLEEASLTVSGNLINHTEKHISGVLNGKIGEIVFSQNFELAPGEKKKMVFSPGTFTQLNIKNPRIWWPNNLGKPELYRLHMDATVNGRISDTQTVHFGIREISDYINKNGHRGYKVNGRPILIRGGGWVDDIFLSYDEKKLETQLKYARHMNLNTIRLEGFWGNSQKLYDLADRYGIMIMIGWSCQWEWENYCGRPEDEYLSIRTPEDIRLHSRAYRDQVVWLRNHPSVILWVYGSDKLLRPELEKKLNEYIAAEDPTRPILASCKGELFGEGKFLISEISGPTGVKMLGPYGYVTPNYWYIDRKLGGAFGFNTEAGPGPQVPPLESIKKMIPPENLWPIDDMWDYHSGRNEFNTLKRYLNAFNRRYGKADTVETFAFNSQISNYEAIRAMFEAYGVYKHNATGIIQWMLNAAWPKMFWQLYDYFLMPNGAFYGTRKACQPVNIVYHYGDKNIYAVNETHTDYGNLKCRIQVLDLDSKVVFKKTVTFGIEKNSSGKIFDMPDFTDIGPVYFIDLKLTGDKDHTLATNFYWLSAKEDVLDLENSEWFITHNKQYADFTGLKNLPMVTLKSEHEFKNLQTSQKIQVVLENPTDKLAFFVELKVAGNESLRTILPVYWDDNYISLLPGETKKIDAYFSTDDLNGEKPVFLFSGFNVKNSGIKEADK